MSESLNPPAIDPEARRVSTQLLRLLTDVWREPVSLYAVALGDCLLAGFGRCLKAFRGGRDPIVPQRWVEDAVQLISDGSLVTIPAAASGHFDQAFVDRFVVEV